MIRQLKDGTVQTVAGRCEEGWRDGPALQAQLSYPIGLAFSADGTLYIADHGNHRVRALKMGQLCTVAGDGTADLKNGPALQARFCYPAQVAIAADGSLLIADLENKRIRVLRNGQIDTLAGGGIGEADALHARFHGPYGVACGLDGSFYITDTLDHKIRKIKDGQVATFAGRAIYGSADGPALQAQLNTPAAVVVSQDDRSMYTSSANGHCIKRLCDGELLTIAGSGVAGFMDAPAALQAQLNGPAGLALASGGSLFISEENGNRIRLLQDGQLSTVAGSGVAGFRDGPALQAQFFAPGPLALAQDGSLLIADFLNNRVRLLKDGHVSTVAGSGVAGFADGPALHAQLNGPSGLAAAPDGSIYISDAKNHRVRLLQNGELRTVAGSGVAGFAEGPALQAELNEPVGLALSPDGALYIADRANHRIRVLKDGELQTHAGRHGGFYDGSAMLALFCNPSSIALASDGSLYVTDSRNHRVRKIFKHTSISIDKGANIFTDSEIAVCSTMLKLHRCFIKLRCPALLDPPAWLQTQHLDTTIIERFKKGLYTGELALNAPPDHMMGFAVRNAPEFVQMVFYLEN